LGHKPEQLPLIVIIGVALALGPRMLRLPTIAGSALVKVIVPVTLNLIVSLPVPAGHPFVAVMVFAAVIASRNAHMPGAPGSAGELTVMVAANAVPPMNTLSKPAMSAQSRKTCLLSIVAWVLPPLGSSI
jgi:hypothetical protein